MKYEDFIKKQSELVELAEELNRNLNTLLLDIPPPPFTVNETMYALLDQISSLENDPPQPTAAPKGFCVDCKDALGESTDEEVCQGCCDHGDKDETYCLQCGKDTFEDMACRAYDMYKDRDRDRD